MTDASHRKPTYEELEAEVESLRRKVGELERELKKVVEVAEKAQREKKRQAAPFSKGEPKKKPRKSGRKSGKGMWATRPKPEQIGETLEAKLPPSCACCGGALTDVKIVDQYHTDLPVVRPVTRHFQIQVGRCASCKKRVQARHPEQKSDAIGGAASQIGPTAIAHAIMLNKSFGLSWGKIAAFFRRAFQLDVTRGALNRACVERVGPDAKPLHDELREQIRGASALGADETSWKVAGHLNWLWIFTTAYTTIYEIEPSRGWEVIAATLGEDFAGLICRDGWSPYRGLDKATHQTCLAHLFKRIADILEVAERGAARFPKRLRRLLKKALALRDERDNYTEHGFAVVLGRLNAELTRLLDWHPTYEPNRRLANHLRKERDAILTFLKHPEVDATNWRAEQGLRPAVVNRKVSGGNRSPRGARAQAILASVIRTCAQRGKDAIDLFVRLLRGEPVSLALAHGPSG